jgi:hypothetical protein
LFTARHNAGLLLLLLLLLVLLLLLRVRTVDVSTKKPGIASCHSPS